MSGENLKIETLTLDDGRRAERHTTIDASGQEVVEIFAEEKRPLKLEKRIVREMKNIVAKEIHQTVKDGEVSYEEIRSLEPEVPLQVRSRVGVADHAKIVDGDYVRKEEIGKLIEDNVVAGITAMMESMEFSSMSDHPRSHAPKSEAAPAFSAQQVLEKHVSEKKSKNSNVINGIMVAVIVVQVAFYAAWVYLT